MKYVLLALSALFAQASFASGIGPAGCGLGNQIFHKENQVLAATTNATFYSQMFGITSGTSGCEEGGRGMAKLENFVEGNRVALSTEAARGYGETVVGVTRILRCEDAEQVGTVLKSNYSTVFGSPEASSADISVNVKNVLRANNVACGQAS